MDSLPAELADYRFAIQWPVQWGDQDAFGHVNNTIYLRWFESARIAYLDQIRFDELKPRAELGPILASITCHYRLPVAYPDTVTIGARITHLGRSSMTMEHRVVSQSAGAVAADGVSTVVVFDYGAHKSHPIPPAVRAAIETLEGKSLWEWVAHSPRG